MIALNLLIYYRETKTKILRLLHNDSILIEGHSYCDSSIDILFARNPW